MRVQIRYGVEMEDVPKESARLMHKAQKILHKTDKPILECVKILEKDEEVNFFEAEGHINEIRTALARADMALNDSFSILAGYEQAKLNQVMPLDEQPPQEVSDGTEVSEG